MRKSVLVARNKFLRKILVCKKCFLMDLMQNKSDIKEG